MCGKSRRAGVNAISQTATLSHSTTGTWLIFPTPLSLHSPVYQHPHHSQRAYCTRGQPKAGANRCTYPNKTDNVTEMSVVYVQKLRSAKIFMGVKTLSFLSAFPTNTCTSVKWHADVMIHRFILSPAPAERYSISMCMLSRLCTEAFPHKEQVLECMSVQRMDVNSSGRGAVGRELPGLSLWGGLLPPPGWWMIGRPGEVGAGTPGECAQPGFEFQCTPSVWKSKNKQ